MRKFLALSFFALMAVLPSQAAPVSAARARQTAQAFFQSRPRSAKAPSRSASSVSSGLSGDSGYSGYSGQSVHSVPSGFSVHSVSSVPAPYYIFNSDSSTGFVIIAGDDTAPAILAYSDQGSLDTANMPPALQALLDGYAAEIKVASTAATATYYASEARQVVAPLLTTSWGQNGIYGKQCFTADGKQAVAGTTAAALAQVMYYYHYPQVMTDAVDAYTSAKGVEYPSMPPAVFDWDLMLDSYKGLCSEEQMAAVAHLYSYAAHAAKTDFGSSYSSASIADCAAALNGCLGYANQTKVVSRDACGVVEWDRLIYHELSHGRPVIYSAANGLDNMYTFVCDGYDGEGFYHLNWGREGEYDGYYRLQAVNLASAVSAGTASSWGYSFKHQAVVGIAPKMVDDNYGELVDAVPAAIWQDLEVTRVEQLPSNNAKKTLRVTVANKGVSDFSGQLRLVFNGSYVSFENLYVPAGGVDFVDFYFVRAADVYDVKVVEGKTMQVLFEDDAFQLFDAEASASVAGYEVLTTDVATMTQNGTHLDVVMRLRNTGEADYFGKVEVTLFIIQSTGAAFIFTTTSKVTQNVAIPAGDISSVKLVADGLKIGDQFYYTISFGSTTIRGGNANRPYTVVDGYAYWDCEGVRRMAPLGAETQVPAGAVAVDFCGCDLSTVVVKPNANPNTLYYIDGNTDVPVALFDANVVMSGAAVGDIVFQDGYDSFVPRSFDVEGTVSYERTFSQGGFSQEGWQTIVLPFGVSMVSSGDKVLEWQHGFDGKNYDFWLRGWQHVSADSAYFEAVDRWMPNVPYLIAVPDDRWGTALDLTNVPLCFSATNTRVEKTDACAMALQSMMLQGTTGEISANDVLVMNEEGDAFERVEEATAIPFRCWFTERAVGAWPYDVAHISSRSSLPGDVNNDGELSVVDVMQLVSYITGSTPLSLPIVAGDVTGDIQISVADVMAVVEMVLH